MAMSSGAAANPGAGYGAQGGRSHLVAGTRIVGDISAPGLLEIQGQVEGRVMADSVVIEERGTVNGEVQAAAVGVKGTFTGHIAGGAVRIHASARLSGTIRYETLSIESGSEITATCEKVRAEG
ncbi:bactofilin family protein [Rubellimicrobium aerolatum]|uniref:Polymer-forming cytoskeletal protein n=1 Tax=Rubellimicrobium aerolatum TaxID=490979 RepID=A0ABW0SG31_9RHOB|nr:polymer-forming cytoskeletal protein [Rubellimicrobium aerolatum]MBP1805849.1 cytoskeletal protein CcmA (bactofilin family) [Rubellimicrobium aerolatum]